MKGILVPSYYPFWTSEGLGDYDRLTRAARKLKHAKLIVVINPSSGPLIAAQDSWFNHRKQFADSVKSAGHHALGYVSTDYGRRPLEDVARDVRLYASQGVVNGVFFDEAAVLPPKRAELVAIARESFPIGCYVVLNCGTDVDYKGFDEYVIHITSETDAAKYDDYRHDASFKDDAIIPHGFANTDWAGLWALGQPEWMYASHVKFAPKNNVWGSLHPAFENLVEFAEAKATPVDDGPGVVIEPTPEPSFLDQLSFHLNELTLLVRDEQARVSKSV